MTKFESTHASNISISLQDALEYQATEEKYTFCLDFLDISANHRNANEMVEELEDRFEAVLAKELKLVANAEAAAAEVEATPTIIENKKGNTGFQLTTWGTREFNFTIDDLVKYDSNYMSTTVNEVKYRIREVEVQSCGKKQMTVTNEGEFIKRFLAPDTTLYATLEGAMQVARDRCTEGLAHAQETAQDIINDRALNPRRYKFTELGMARHESEMAALREAKKIVDNNDITLVVEGGVA